MDRLGGTFSGSYRRDGGVPEPTSCDVHGNVARLAESCAVRYVEPEIHVPPPRLDVVGVQWPNAGPTPNTAMAVASQDGVSPVLVGHASTGLTPPIAQASVAARHVAVVVAFSQSRFPVKVDQGTARVAGEPLALTSPDCSARRRAIGRWIDLQAPARGRCGLTAGAARHGCDPLSVIAKERVPAGQRAELLARVVRLMRPYGKRAAALVAGLLSAFAGLALRAPASQRAEAENSGAVFQALEGPPTVFTGTLYVHRDLPLSRNRGAGPGLFAAGAGPLAARIIPEVAA